MLFAAATLAACTASTRKDPAQTSSNPEPAPAIASEDASHDAGREGSSTMEQRAKAAPLTGDALVSLPVPGFAPAVVSLPLGRTDRRPVIVAAHGNYDRPEWQCQTWRQMVGDEAFIVCPRGSPRPDSPSPDDRRFTYGRHESFLAEVNAALAAVSARYPAHVAEGPVVYVGFSLGAIHGSRLLTRPAAAAPVIERAVLIEGGHDPWTREGARAFARKGGKRILFACGQPGCVKTSERVRALLEKEKIEVGVVFGSGVGHGYTGAVSAKIEERYRWLVEGDARFAVLVVP